MVRFSLVPASPESRGFLLGVCGSRVQAAFDACSVSDKLMCSGSRRLQKEHSLSGSETPDTEPPGPQFHNPAFPPGNPLPDPGVGSPDVAAGTKTFLYP